MHFAQGSMSSSWILRHRFAVREGKIPVEIVDGLSRVFSGSELGLLENATVDPAKAEALAGTEEH